jgi:ABC-type branched-subunit amino acid transport system ATPase component
LSVLLQTTNLCKSFGALTVASNINLSLKAGDRHALIGPNGAGKTTLVNMLTGALKPSSGSIALLGADVTHLRQAARVKRGLGRTFQINTLFKQLPVLDNVALGVAERLGVAHRMWTPASKHREIVQESEELLSSMGLADDRLLPVSELPYGKQRLVEMAIALGLRPKVLLLDEPAAGVPSMESQRILDVLEKLPAETAVLIIEHDMDLVFRFAQRITVLLQGEVLVEGTPAEIAANKRVHQVYLGEQHG